MKELIALILKLDKYKLARIDVLNSKDSNSRYTQVYREIIKGKLKTEEDVAHFLSPNKKIKGTPAFSNFKKEFSDRVLTTLLFIDPDHDDFGDDQRLKFESNKKWISIINLYENLTSSLATPLAEELLELAIENEFIEIVVSLLRKIKGYYAMLGDKKKYFYHEALFHHYKKFLDDEFKAREYQEHLMIEYAKSGAYRPQNSELAKKYFYELAPLLKTNTSLAFQVNARTVEMYIHFTINNHEGLLDVCNRAINFFEAKTPYSKSAISIFTGQKTIALMGLKRFEEALDTIEKTIAMRVPGSFNWFKAQEYKMFLLFRMKNYTAAFYLYQSIVSHSAFKTLTGLNSEIWKLFDSNLQMVHKVKKLELTLVETNAIEYDKDFNLLKFLNDTETAANDKFGFNLSRLIMKLSWLLLKNKLSEITDKEENLKRYLTRHTENDGLNKRFQVFVKMLIELASIANQSIKNSDLLLKLIKEFNETENTPTDPFYRLEVIDLEEVWEMVLENAPLELPMEIPLTL